MPDYSCSIFDTYFDFTVFNIGKSDQKCWSLTFLKEMLGFIFSTKTVDEPKNDPICSQLCHKFPEVNFFRNISESVHYGIQLNFRFKDMVSQAIELFVLSSDIHLMTYLSSNKLISK